MRNLRGTPGGRPSPVLPTALTTAGPADAGAANRSGARCRNEAGQPRFDIRAQRRLRDQLRDFGAARGALGVPLRRQRPIVQSPTPRRGIATQFTRDRRRGPSEQARAGAHANTLHAQQRELLTLHE